MSTNQKRIEAHTASMNPHQVPAWSRTETCCQKKKKHHGQLKLPWSVSVTIYSHHSYFRSIPALLKIKRFD